MLALLATQNPLNPQSRSLVELLCALGGQHELAGLTGAAYKFTTAKFFTRATGTEPVVGRVIITVEKDRPGYVRGRTDEGGSGSSCSRATRTAR